MKTVGILCEYNPFHLGHQRQIRVIQEKYGANTAIVCLMSGNYVQRGEPAVFDRMVRARAALESGADLVLELPVNYALRSAEGFAAGAVSILGTFCDEMSFGAEHPDPAGLMAAAETLLSPAFSEALRGQLALGLSFPAARQRALEAMGLDGALLASPNDILAVEYCKAIRSQHTAMVPAPIHRPGSYHAQTADPENPSATALRRCIEEGRDISPYVPTEGFRDAAVHTLQYGERAMLARLRTMRDEEFESLPFGSEGLWRKLMHESRRQPDLESILTAVKSKRYTRTRLSRMVLCAFLGLTKSDLDAPAPYARILGFTDRGREVLRLAKEHTPLYNVGQKVDHPWQQVESRCSDLYGLFARVPEPPGQAYRDRVVVPARQH